MKIKRWNKGQMRVIEAILASLIIVAALTFVNFFSVNPSREKYEISELDRLGYNVLHGLDMEGILGEAFERSYIGHRVDWSNDRIDKLR